MSYATRGGAPASSVNELQDPGQYFGDDRRRLVRKQKGKARDQLRPRGPDYRTKPVANDLLKELLATPGGIKQMSDAAQYGKLVEMRQKQAMIDRSDGAMREFQRLTQGMTGAQRGTLRQGYAPVGLDPTVARVVQNAVARQKRELQEAGASVQGRAVQRDQYGVPIGVGGAGNVGVTPLVSDTGGGGGGFDPRSFGIGRSMGRGGK